MDGEPGLVPAGFEPLHDYSGFHLLLGQMYHRPRPDGAGIGMVVDARHLNRYGRLHGGALAAFLDVALGITILLQPGAAEGNFTVSLSIDFMDAGWAGEWLEATVTLPKTGRRLAFAECEVHCGGRRIGRASGVWSLKRPQSPASTEELQ